MHRSAEPFGAFALWNQRREPNEVNLWQRVRVSHNRKSMSWQHLEISIGLVISSLRHMPLTNPCVERSIPTDERWFIEIILPNSSVSISSLIFMKYGWYRNTWQTATITPFSFAALAMHSSSVWAIGFSNKTWNPLRMAIMLGSKCMFSGVHIRMASDLTGLWKKVL